MSNLLFYIIMTLGILAGLCGALWDLTRGHRQLKNAEREAGRMSPTRKFK